MSSAKVAAAAVLVAMSLSACGVAAKPVAGSQAAATSSKHNAFDPRTRHEMCLRKVHVKYHNKYQPIPGVGGKTYPTIQVRTRPSGPTVLFLATPGAAQDSAIQGQSQGAEAIGSALMYPNQASDTLLNKVEICVELAVTG